MTLIDKAEALLPCPFCGGEPDGYEGNRVACRCGAMGPHEVTGDPECPQWNAALPERGVGVPADVRDYAIDVSEAYDTMMEVERNPAGAWQAIQALAGHLAALTPTDAAQAREAALEMADLSLPTILKQTREDALRDAAAEIQRWWEDNSDNREPTPLILALIGEARDD